MTFLFVCREKSRCALRGGRNGFQKAAPPGAAGPPWGQAWPQAPRPPGPGRLSTAWVCACWRLARRRNGKPSLHLIVFLNAFMNNSKRKYYSLAGSQGPAQCRSAGLGAAKANTLPAPPLFSPVFQINRCLSEGSPAPASRRGGHSPFVSNVPGYLQHCYQCSRAAQAPTTLPLGPTAPPQCGARQRGRWRWARGVQPRVARLGPALGMWRLGCGSQGSPVALRAAAVLRAGMCIGSFGAKASAQPGREKNESGFPFHEVQWGRRGQEGAHPGTLSCVQAKA